MERERIFLLERWTVQMLAESFDQSVANVRLILQQRTRRGMRVRARPPSSLFGVQDEEQAEKIIREHLIQRDLLTAQKSTSPTNDDEPVDHQILAEESHLIPRQRPSSTYLQRDVSGLFEQQFISLFRNRMMDSFPMSLKMLINNEYLHRKH